MQDVFDNFKGERMTVHYIYRKKDPIYFSIENVFGEVSEYLNDFVIVKKWSAPDFGISLRNLVEAYRYTRGKRSDIFHITGGINYLTFVFPRSNSILTIHDCRYIDESKGIKKIFLKLVFLQLPIWWAKRVTAISEKTKDDILRLAGLGHINIDVIPNPVDDNIKSIKKKVKKGNSRILFIGSTPNKNLDRVLQALKDIKCTLNIIADITANQRLFLLENKFEYILEKQLSHEDIINRYVQADIILFPSLYEGFGLPILEGQKSGTLVITSDLPPMNDVAGNGAILVNPFSVESIREAVLSAINSPVLAERIVEEGYLNVQEYSISKIASKYFDLYKSFKK